MLCLLHHLGLLNRLLRLDLLILRHPVLVLYLLKGGGGLFHRC